MIKVIICITAYTEDEDFPGCLFELFPESVSFLFSLTKGSAYLAMLRNPEAGSMTESYKQEHDLQVGCDCIQLGLLAVQNL